MRFCGCGATIGTLIGTAAILLADDNSKIMFAEKFTSPLSAGWHWIREDPKAWKVKHGTLLLRSLPGYLYLKHNDARNVLLQKVPVTSKDLILEVYLENQPKIL